MGQRQPRVMTAEGMAPGGRPENRPHPRRSTVSGGDPFAVPLATYRTAYHPTLRLRPRSLSTAPHAACIAPPRIATGLDRVIRSP